MARSGPGVTEGLGGVLYAVSQVSGLLDEPVLSDEAASACRGLDPMAVGGARDAGLASGRAGAVVGLLALHHVTGDPALLKAAARCGGTLVGGMTHRLATRIGGKPVPAPPDCSLLGGSSGVAHALFGLAQATGDGRFAQAAREALLPYRPSGRPGTGAVSWVEARWCDGLAGVALAHLHGSGTADRHRVAERLMRAVTALPDDGPGDVDQICCGGFGILDVALEAGLNLVWHDLTRAARRRAAAAIHRAERAGGFRLGAPMEEGDLDARFLRGTAGIGYVLLRLASPAGLPAVLSWKTPAEGLQAPGATRSSGP